MWSEYAKGISWAPGGLRGFFGSCFQLYQSIQKLAVISWESSYCFQPSKHQIDPVSRLFEISYQLFIFSSRLELWRMLTYFEKFYKFLLRSLLWCRWSFLSSLKGEVASLSQEFGHLTQYTKGTYNHFIGQHRCQHRFISTLLDFAFQFLMFWI